MTEETSLNNKYSEGIEKIMEMMVLVPVPEEEEKIWDKVNALVKKIYGERDVKALKELYQIAQKHVWRLPPTLRKDALELLDKIWRIINIIETSPREYMRTLHTDKLYIIESPLPLILAAALATKISKEYPSVAEKVLRVASDVMKKRIEQLDTILRYMEREKSTGGEEWNENIRETREEEYTGPARQFIIYM